LQHRDDLLDIRRTKSPTVRSFAGLEGHADPRINPSHVNDVTTIGLMAQLRDCNSGIGERCYELSLGI
jgi:hypothetical protein